MQATAVRYPHTRRVHSPAVLPVRPLPASLPCRRQQELPLTLPEEFTIPCKSFPQGHIRLGMAKFPLSVQGPCLHFLLLTA